MSQTTDPRLGTTIAGYRVDAIIGRGGMGVVYLAEHLRLQRRVALKLLAPDLVDRPGFRERFIRESRLAASIDHPNILPVYDADEVGDVLYIAMRYVEGTDLKRLIENRGRLEPPGAVRIVAQVASALDAAQARGLVHRDVKPGNILIAAASGPAEDGHVYLSDFGLTKRTSSDSGLTATGQFVGTLDYAAPEQFEGGALDARTDEYSLGCVLFECLTGVVPFVRDNDAAVMYAHLQAPSPKVSEHRPDLPPAIDAVVTTAMAKDPSDRYATAGALAAAAAEALGVTPVLPTTPSTPTGPLPAQPRRRRAGILLGAAAAVVAVVVLLVVVLNRDDGSGSGATGQSATPALTDHLARVDPSTGEVTARIPAGSDPMDVAVGEGSVWVLNEDGSVDRVDPVNGEVTRIRDVAQDPQAIAAGEGGAWVADGTKLTIRRIDSGTNRVSSIPVTGFATDVAVGGGAVWALKGQDIARIDPATSQPSVFLDSLLAPVPTQNGLIAVGGTDIWAVPVGFGDLAPVSIETGEPGQRIDVEFGIRDLAADGASVWAATCGTPGTVARVESGQVMTIPVGGAICDYQGVAGTPISIAAGTEGVWVTDSVNGTVSQIRTATNQVGVPIRIGDTPTAVAVGLGSVWVAVDGSTS